MKISFEHDYQQKILSMSFDEPCSLQTEDDVLRWRQLWMEALKSWHSPYKALIDASQLSLHPEAKPEAIASSLQRMAKVLSGFFLKTAVIYGIEDAFAALMPFSVAESEEKARELIGVRAARPKGEGLDFRSSIQLQNHFRQHVVELSFAQLTSLDSLEKMQMLRGKLTNNLMQWHSAWSLLIDCSQLQVSPELHPEWQKMQTFFKGFFLKEVLGYSPIKEQSYPFTTYRARHNAAGRLEAEGLFSGEDADCKSRK